MLWNVLRPNVESSTKIKVSLTQVFIIYKLTSWVEWLLTCSTMNSRRLKTHYLAFMTLWCRKLCYTTVIHYSHTLQGGNILWATDWLYRKSMICSWVLKVLWRRLLSVWQGASFFFSFFNSSRWCVLLLKDMSPITAVSSAYLGGLFTARMDSPVCVCERLP